MIAYVYEVYPEISHCSYRPLKFVILLKNSPLFNTFYCLFCLYIISLRLKNLKTQKAMKKELSGFIYVNPIQNRGERQQKAPPYNFSLVSSTNVRIKRWCKLSVPYLVPVPNY